MNALTTREIYLIFDALEDKHGGGWEGSPEVRTLKAKLSLLLEMAYQPEEIRGKA